MSRHVSLKQRWAQVSTTEYKSTLGRAVYGQKGWFGILNYRTRLPDETALAVWQAHSQTLGPFKRPRNAMIAVEREAAFLKNHHGQDLLLEGQV
jgi:hypothetical protein